MYIDTHCHLYLEPFESDMDSVIASAHNLEVKKMLIPNIDMDSIRGMHFLCERYPDSCYPMMGLHPCEVKENYKNILDQMILLFDQRKYIAVGECGLDYYWDKTYIIQQAEALQIQIQWAKEKKLPIVLHTRDSINDTLEIIEKAQDGQLSGVFHCFSGSIEQAQRIINAGFKISMGGVITYKNVQLEKVLLDIGLDHIMLETDAPFLSPAPHRGKRNSPEYIPIIAQRIAEIVQMPKAEIAAITTRNAYQLFQL